MYLIVGLGNIGSKYNKTRHNVGFEVIDLISKKYNIDVFREKFKGMVGEGRIGDERVALLKPSTYMNLSGESVIAAASFYKIEISNIIIVADDISLPIGRLRIREKGSAGGHNGLKNIILNLNSQDFTRVKIGVDMPKHDLVSHVLGKFQGEEKETIDIIYNVSIEAIESIILNGVNEAMNKYNGFKIE